MRYLSLRIYLADITEERDGIPCDIDTYRKIMNRDAHAGEENINKTYHALVIFTRNAKILRARPIRWASCNI